jgi:Domain of unknown function (DUF4389)
VSENPGPASEPPREPESQPEPAVPASQPEPAIPASQPEAAPAAAAPQPEPASAPPPPPAPPPAATAPPPPPAAVSPTTNIPLGGSGYPVNVTFDPDEGQNRLWGIPLLGMVIRSILIIPQAIVLMVLGFVMFFVLLVNWIPVLVTGRQAGWAYTIVGGYLRLSTRVAGYILLLTGRYPPFGPGGEHTIDVTFDETEEQNRLWGIPIVGIWVRWILLIPHFIVLWFLAIIVAFMILVTWVPILVSGRTADWVVRWVGGFYRWTSRVTAYALLLTGTYPPFRLDE